MKKLLTWSFIRGVIIVVASVLIITGVVYAQQSLSSADARITVTTGDVYLNEPSPEVGFASLIDEGKLVIAYNFDPFTTVPTAVNGWTWYDPTLPPAQNNLAKLHKNRAYWIKVTEECWLTYGGKTYHLAAGWNNPVWYGVIEPKPAALTVHFIDVGQGDSILLDLGDIEVLIDGGDKYSGVVAYVGDYIDGPLEVMVATHPHADHIGGLIAVLNAFEVDEIWLNGDTSTSQTYSQFMSAVNSEGAAVCEVRRGDTIQVGNLIFDVLHPVNVKDTTNNNSIVLRLSYGQVDFLLTGDAEQEAEASMLTEGIVPDVEVLKVGHHGSRTASSIQFLQAAKPECAIYMAGEGNSYGHPHEETIINLCEVGAQIYGTDIHGTVVVTTDGETHNLLPSNDVPPVVCPTATTHDLTISVNGQGTTNPSVGTHEYDSGTPVTITASPASGWKLDYWSGDASGTSPAIVIVMDSDKYVTAYFAEETSIGSNVQITYIFYDGVVYRTESDEYVEITNLGDTSQDLEGWVLKDISDGYPSFTFPSYILTPSAQIRVYTNEIHPEWGGFSFGYGKAIWNNTAPDWAALYNTHGYEVSRKSY